jgi:hypothetical protein
VVEIKDKEINPNSEFDSENTERRKIIDTDPTTIFVTATFQPEEPKYVGKGDPTSFYCS